MNFPMAFRRPVRMCKRGLVILHKNILEEESVVRLMPLNTTICATLIFCQLILLQYLGDLYDLIFDSFLGDLL